VNSEADHARQYVYATDDGHGDGTFVHVGSGVRSPNVAESIDGPCETH
jgi:hypothetical protein